MARKIQRVLVCKRCGHKWIRRVAGNPETCPDCRSPYWHKARIGSKGRK